MADESTIQKINALMALAESTPYGPEQDACFAKAQQLASANMITLEMAQRRAGVTNRSETPEKEYVTMGNAGTKGLYNSVNLFYGVAEANDVQCAIAHNSTYVVAYGFPSDIEVTKLLFVHLVVQMQEASQAYLDKGEYKNDTYYNEKEGRYKKVDGRVARNSFQAAFANRISTRLREARNEAMRKYDSRRDLRELSTGTPSTDLVLREKKSEVDAYIKSLIKQRNRQAHWKGGSSSGMSQHGVSAGRAAANSASLTARKGISA